MRKILIVLIIASFFCALFLKSMVYNKALNVQAVKIDDKSKENIVMKGINDSLMWTSIDHVGEVFVKIYKDAVMVRNVILNINLHEKLENLSAALDFSIINESEDDLINSTISTLHEDKIPLDDSLDMIGDNTQTIDMTYFILGNSVALLGLLLSIFSLNPNVNVFKRPFKFISKKFEAK